MNSFFKYYDAGKVVIFFLELQRIHPRVVIEQFINYHNDQLLSSWQNIFPRPDLHDIWWRWSLLPANLQTFYVKIFVPNWKQPLF